MITLNANNANKNSFLGSKMPRTYKDMALALRIVSYISSLTIPCNIMPMAGLIVSQGLQYSVSSNLAINANCAGTCQSISIRNSTLQC